MIQPALGNASMTKKLWNKNIEAYKQQQKATYQVNQEVSLPWDGLIF
jgi:hypothetical protein